MIQVAYSPNTFRARGSTNFTDWEWAAGFRRVPDKQGEMIATTSSLQGMDIQSYITQLLGSPPVSDRYIGVSGGRIIWVGTADPAIDGAVPGCTMYQHDSADASWAFDPVRLTVTQPGMTVQETMDWIAAKQARGIQNPVPPAPIVSVVVAVPFVSAIISSPS